MEVEHSRLLKFFKESREDETEMAEKPEIPVIKIEKDYQSPANVEAEVPGTQKIRECDENFNSFGNLTGVNHTFKPTMNITNNINSTVTITGADFTFSPKITVTEKDNSSEITITNAEEGKHLISEVKTTGGNFTFSPNVTITNKDNSSAIIIPNAGQENNNSEIKITGSEDDQKNSSDKVTGSESGEHNSSEIKVTGADFTYSPVITVTKKESTLTKSDMKQQKLTVTEDISEEDTEDGGYRISHKVETLTQTNGQPDSLTVKTSDRRTEERVTEKMEGEENNQDDTKSKIPLLRLKQAAETVKKERKAQKAQRGQPRRSSIPKLTKDAKKVSIKRDVSLNITPQVDDEFDKLYEEIVDHKLKEVEEKLPSVTMEDPEKIETKFEEIIHAYDEDEHDKQTISRVSKIPALRRKPDEGSSRLGALIDRAKEKSTVTETKLKDGGFKVTASTIRTKRISRGNSKDLSSEQQVEVTETIDINDDNDVFVKETVVKIAPTEMTFRHITKRVVAENKAEVDKNIEDDSQKTVVTENLDKKDGTMNKTKRFNRTVSKETRERNLNRELSKNLQDIRREFRNRIEDSRIDPEFNDFDDHDITTKTIAKENADATPVKKEKIIRGVSKEINKDGQNISSTETVTVEKLEDGATRTVTTKTTESLVIGTPLVTEKIIRKISRERSTEGEHNNVKGVTSIEEITDEGDKKITTYVRENATGIPVKTERFTRGISREMGNIKQRSRSKDIVTPVSENKRVLNKETMPTELIEKEGVKGIPVYTKVTRSFSKGKIENVEMSRTIEWKPADEVKTKNFSRSVSEKVTKKELKDAGKWKYETPVAISEDTDVNNKPTDQNDNDEAHSAQKYPVLASKIQDNIKDLASKITTKKVTEYKSEEQIANVEKTPYIDFSRSVSEKITKKELKGAGKWKYETPVAISEVTDINDKLTAQNGNDEAITKTNPLKYPVLESKTQDNIKDMANKITTKKVKEYKSEEQITNVEKTTYTLSSNIDLSVDRDYKVSREIGTQMSIDGKPVDRIFKYVKEFGTQMSEEGKSLDLSCDREVKLPKEKNLPNNLTSSTTDKDASSKEFGTQISTDEKTVVLSFDGESKVSREFGTQMSVVGKIVDRDFKVSKEISTQMSLDGTKQENDYNKFSNENITPEDIITEKSETVNNKLSTQTKGSDNAEVTVLKGNVNRLKDKIAKETVTVTMKEPEDELPKKKSVLSKIAIFERLEPKEHHPVIEVRRIKCKYVPPNLNRTNSADRPKIVDEVLKEPIQSELVEDTKQVEIGENYDEVTYRSEPAVTEYWSTKGSNVTNIRQVTTTTKATSFHSQQETRDFEMAKILPTTIDFDPEESQIELPKTTDVKAQIQREPSVIEMPTIFPARIDYEADIGKTKPGKINLNVWSTQVEINKSTVDKIDVLKEESLHDIAQTLPGKSDFKTNESHVPVSADLPGFTDFKIEDNQIHGVTILPAKINFISEEIAQTLVGRNDSKIDDSQNEVSDHITGITQGYLFDDITTLPAKIDFKSYEIQTEVATTLPGKIEETEIEKTLTAFGFVPVTKDNKKTETNLKGISTKPKPGKINLGLWQSQVETNKTYVGKTDIRKSKEAEMTKALSGRPNVFNRDRKQIRVTEAIQGTTRETQAAIVRPLPETVNYSTASYSSQEEVATTLPAIINFSSSENQIEEPKILIGKIDFDMEFVNSESKAGIRETIQDNSSTNNQTESFTTFSSQNNVEKVGKLNLKAWEHEVEINKTLVDKIDVVKGEHLEEIANTLGKIDVTYESHVGEAKTFQASINSNTEENKVQIIEIEGDAEVNDNKVEVAKILPGAITIDPFKHTPRFKPLPMLIRLNSHENIVLENEIAQGGKDNVYKVDIPIDSIPVSPGFSIDSNPLSPGFSDPELDDEDTSVEHKKTTESIIGSIKRKLFFITNKRTVLDSTNTPMNTPVPVETEAGNDYEKKVDELLTKTYSINDIGPKTHEAKTVSSLTNTVDNTYDITSETIEESYSNTTDYNQSNSTTEYEHNFDSNMVQNKLPKSGRQEQNLITSPSDYKQKLNDFENNKNVTNETEFNFDVTRIENTLTRSAYGADDFKTSTEELKRAKSLAELDLGDVVHGKVKRIVGRIKSVNFDRRGSVKTEINIKELPRKMSVLEKIALFEEKTAQAKLTTVRTTTKISTTPVLSEWAYRQNIQELTTQSRPYTSTTARTTTKKITTTPILSEETNHQKIEELTGQSRSSVLTTARTATTEKNTTPISSEEANHGKIEESTVQSRSSVTTTAKTATTEKNTTPILSEVANHGKIEESTVQLRPSISTTAKTATTEKYTTPVLSEEPNHGKIGESTVHSRQYVSTTTRTTTEKTSTPIISEEAYQQKIAELTTQSTPFVSTTTRTTTTEKSSTPIASEEAYQQKIAELTTQSTPFVSTTTRTTTTEKSSTPITSEEAYQQNIEELTTQSSPLVSTTARTTTTEKTTTPIISEEEYQQKIEDLKAAKTLYGRLENMLYLPLADGHEIPVLALGTALMDTRLLPHIIGAAIDMGYRAIDTAYIYGNEKEIGQGIKSKIDDGTVKREDLFIISKLWSTYHRTDLVEEACNASLNNLGLSYFDLYLIHNPMSFKEGSDPIPKIASVVQYSQHDFLDAWYGMEALVNKGLAKSIGVSNFNAHQIQRILDKGRIKPVVNQVENHPYLTQQRLDNFCTQRNITLSCFGVLGSKGTPAEYKNSTTPVIDDALVKVMASGLGISPAQLLIRYQIERGHNVVVKASSAAHLWDDLQALTFTLDKSQVDALSALNRQKRTFVFKGMGDTHKNYPFSES